MGSAEVQGKLWGIAARDWAELQEPMSTPLWKAMLDAARVGPGTRFFDAGCGGGGACVIAMERGAQVSGLDASAALIAIARDRLPDGDFRVGELEALPYSEGAFDAVIAANSVQYATDPVAALRELGRVCAKRGRIVVATLGAPEDCELRHIFKAVRETLPSPPPGEGPFALSVPGAFEGLVQRAGLTVIGSGEVDCPYDYPDLETVWRGNRSAGSLQAFIQIVGEEQIKAAVLKAVDPYQNRDGSIRMKNRFRFLIVTP